MQSPALGLSLPPRYRLDGPVAAGGMAAVYAAHDTLLDRPVAIKVLAEHLNQDVAARERFQREARAAAALSFHPGIVTIFDVGEHEGRSFIVMELLRGGTIGDVLRADVRPTPEQVAGWVREAAAALDTAHERGIVHRDIKPANLLLDEKGTIAVADFGIARLAWEDAVTMTGQVLGTASYISPEQAQGEPATAASDRYALAVVAYELLTGSKPFDGEHFAAQARAHIEDDPTPPSHRDPSLPRAIDPVFSRGMAKDPAARWPTAAAFAEAVADALRPTEVHAAAVPETEPVQEPRTTERMPPPPQGAVRVTPRLAAAPPAPPVVSRRRNVLPIALGLGLVALVLGAILLGSSGGGDPARTTAAEPTTTPAAEDTSEDKAEATPTATAESTPAAPAAAPETGNGNGNGKAKGKKKKDAGAVPAGGDPQALDAQGFRLLGQQRYDEAIPYFQKAIDLCGGSDAPFCGYALFNMGTALNRSGRAEEAIPFLQQRLDRFPDDRPDIVRRELASACRAAGRDCG